MTPLKSITRMSKSTLLSSFLLLLCLASLLHSIDTYMFVRQKIEGNVVPHVDVYHIMAPSTGNPLRCSSVLMLNTQSHRKWTGGSANKCRPRPHKDQPFNGKIQCHYTCGPARMGHHVPYRHVPYRSRNLPPTLAWSPLRSQPCGLRCHVSRDSLHPGLCEFAGRKSQRRLAAYWRLPQLHSPNGHVPTGSDCRAREIHGRSIRHYNDGIASCLPGLADAAAISRNRW